VEAVRRTLWSPNGLTGLGLAFIGLWVVAVLTIMDTTGYETYAPLFIAPILVAVSLPVLSRQAKREGSEALFWILVAALVLKLLSAFIRDFVAFEIYGGSADAAAYHREGVRISENFLAGNFDAELPNLISTNFIHFLTGLVYTLIGTSRLGGFLVFSWLGFWGVFLFYRAFTVALPEGNARLYARLVFFLPSLLFWPSSIGKEAWMMFTVGIVAYGAARLLSGATMRGLVGVGIGLWLAGFVRPHVAGLLGIALGAAYLIRPPSEKLRELGPIVKTFFLVVLAVTAGFLVVKTDKFLTNAGIDTTSGNTVVGGVQERTSSGGSEFTPASIIEDPQKAPIGVITVLFRPFPNEAHNTQALGTALEGTFLLLFSLYRLRYGLAALGSMRRRPYVAFALIYSGLFIVAFSTLANFGLLARERVMLLPLYLLLFCVPAREKRAEKQIEQIERPREAQLVHS
jgi:hypothetical protein